MCAGTVTAPGLETSAGAASDTSRSRSVALNCSARSEALSNTFERMGMVVRRSTTLVTWPRARRSSPRSITSCITSLAGCSLAWPQMSPRRSRHKTRGTPRKAASRRGDSPLCRVDRDALLCKRRHCGFGAVLARTCRSGAHAPLLPAASAPLDPLADGLETLAVRCLPAKLALQLVDLVLEA